MWIMWMLNRKLVGNNLKFSSTKQKLHGSTKSSLFLSDIFLVRLFLQLLHTFAIYFDFQFIFIAAINKLEHSLKF